MLHKDAWLSQYFVGGAYRLGAPYDGALHDGAFTYVKLGQDQRGEISRLCSAGFHFVEVSVQFEQTMPVLLKPLLGFDIAHADITDRAGVVDLAGRAFTTSRFFMDAHIPREVAVQIKSAWADNFFKRQRGDGMVVARREGRVCAFLLLVDERVIDLIAVDDNYRGQGLARAMIAFANQERGLLQAGTQLLNKASIAFYERCVFRLSNSQYVLHWHGDKIV